MLFMQLFSFLMFADNSEVIPANNIQMIVIPAFIVDMLRNSSRH